MKQTAIVSLTVAVAYPGRNDAEYDLALLLLPAGHTIPISKAIGALNQISVSQIDRHRLAFLRTVHEVICSRLEENASRRSVGNLIQILRRFWAFLEGRSAIPSSFSAPLWSKAFADWVQELWQRVKREQLVERSAGTYAWSIANLIASVFQMPTDEFIGRTLMPRVNVSAASDRYENLDLSAIDRFLADIDDIVDSIPTDMQSVRWPHRIKFRDSTTYVFPSVGAPSVSVERLATQAEVARLVELRTQAEMLRFIGATGCNLQVTVDLLVEDCTFESFGKLYRVHGLKIRRDDFVDIRVPNSYKSKLEAWLEFRRIVFSDGLSVSRLFPLIARSGQESAMAAERGFRVVRRVLSNREGPQFGPMELRFARSQRLLRKEVVGRDIELISHELQNSIATIHRNYLRGNQQMSAVEFGKFVSTIIPTANTQRLRNGGACEHPQTPQRINIVREDAPEPDCTNPAGCFFCSHFRAVAERDFLHAMLSYREFLRIRSAFCSEDQEIFFREIAPTIERLNDFVMAISESGSEMSSLIKELERIVEDGHHHRHWHGWVELASFSGKQCFP